MSPCVSAGIKSLKLHDREPEIGKYPETKKRINMMRRQLEKFEDENPQAKKRVNKIRRQIQKLEHELDQGESDEEEVLDDINTNYTAFKEQELTAVKKKEGQEEPTRRVRIYDPDSSDRYTVRRIQQSAKIAIGYFNKQSPIRYYVVDFIRATRQFCAGLLFVVTFAAKTEGGEEAKTFEAMVYHGIGRTEVEYVKIVDTSRWSYKSTIQQRGFLSFELGIVG